MTFCFLFSFLRFTNIQRYLPYSQDFSKISFRVKIWFMMQWPAQKLNCLSFNLDFAGSDISFKAFSIQTKQLWAVHKGVRSQGRKVCPVWTREILQMQTSTLFGAKKLQMFQNLWCVRMDKGDQFFAILCERPLWMASYILLLFVHCFQSPFLNIGMNMPVCHSFSVFPNFSKT